MVLVPLETPVTVPAKIVATAVLLLLQVPVSVVSANAVVAPTYAVNVPVMAPTVGVVVTTNAAVLLVEPQELLNVYDTESDPAPTPVTTPVLELTVAIEVLLLLHAPPVVASVKVTVPPEHTVSVPPIATGTEGAAFTVTTAVA